MLRLACLDKNNQLKPQFHLSNYLRRPWKQQGKPMLLLLFLESLQPGRVKHQV